MIWKKAHAFQKNWVTITFICTPFLMLLSLSFVFVFVVVVVHSSLWRIQFFLSPSFALSDNNCICQRSAAIIAQVNAKWCGVIRRSFYCSNWILFTCFVRFSFVFCNSFLRCVCHFAIFHKQPLCVLCSASCILFHFLLSFSFHS